MQITQIFSLLPEKKLIKVNNCILQSRVKEYPLKTMNPKLAFLVLEARNTLLLRI